MKALLPLFALAGVSAAVFALGNLRKGSDDRSILNVADEVALSVNVAKPEQRRIVRMVQAPGDVEAVLEVGISSEIVAKIEEMPVQEGDIVKKGDLLCRLNDKDLRAAVESGEASVAQAGRLGSSRPRPSTSRPNGIVGGRPVFPRWTRPTDLELSQLHHSSQAGRGGVGDAQAGIRRGRSLPPPCAGRPQADHHLFPDRRHHRQTERQTGGSRGHPAP